MNLNIMLLRPGVRPPQYATAGAAAFDLTAEALLSGPPDQIERFAEGQPGCITFDTPATFGTGIAAEVPNGYVMLVCSRSGAGFRNDTRLANCVGVIDSDYRGEIAVKLTRDYCTASAPLQVARGDRIAQAFIVPAERCTFTVAGDLNETARGKRGFGSTGRSTLHLRNSA